VAESHFRDFGPEIIMEFAVNSNDILFVMPAKADIQ
jgi:hypothetical protein